MSAAKARKAVAVPVIVLADAARETIAAHLREQQGRIYHAAQSVQIAMKAIDAMDECGMNKDLVTLWGALALIEDTLNDIGKEIDEGAASVLEVSHGG
jgi:DNA-directed RNA polymerase specialized sigma54-like protein